MGVFADLIASQSTMSNQGLDFLRRLIAQKLDPPINAAVDAKNQVWTLPEYSSDPSGGTFKFTVTLRNGETFTTGNIAYNATAATIEGAIDTAATAASITDWTNGDISVAAEATNLTDGDMVITFDGDSVAADEHDLSVNKASLTGGTWADPDVETTTGQSVRNALGVLIAVGVIDDGTIPIQTATAATASFVTGGNLVRPHIPPWFIRELAVEAGAEDRNNDIYVSLMNLINQIDRAPAVQIGTAANRTLLFDLSFREKRRK